MEAALSAAFGQREKSMKSALAVLLVLVTVPTFAQEAPDAPPALERAALLGVDGPRTWGVGINGQAVGWYFSQPRSHITVSARLGNGGGHAYLDAYLMKRIGPGTTRKDEIARTSLDLPYPYDGWVDLFTDLDLDGGYYWLVIAKPWEKSHSSINWFVAQPPGHRDTCGVHSLGSQSYTFHFDAASYIPASKFEKKFEPYTFQFEISEVRPAGTEPCP